MREFVLKELAGILYGCVECDVNPRDKIDWYTAEQWLNNNNWLIDLITNIKQEAYKNGHRAHTWLYGDDALKRYIWDNAWQRSLKRCLPRPPYGKITFE